MGSKNNSASPRPGIGILENNNLRKKNKTKKTKEREADPWEPVRISQENQNLRETEETEHNAEGKSLQSLPGSQLPASRKGRPNLQRQSESYGFQRFWGETWLVGAVICSECTGFRSHMNLWTGKAGERLQLSIFLERVPGQMLFWEALTV